MSRNRHRRSWAEQQTLEEKLTTDARLRWLADIDQRPKAEAARDVGINRSLLHRIIERAGYRWRDQPRLSIADMQAGMTDEQRKYMDRSMQAGMRPVYAAIEAMRAER